MGSPEKKPIRLAKLKGLVAPAGVSTYLRCIFESHCCSGHRGRDPGRAFGLNRRHPARGEADRAAYSYILQAAGGFVWLKTGTLHPALCLRVLHERVPNEA